MSCIETWQRGPNGSHLEIWAEPESDDGDHPWDGRVRRSSKPEFLTLLEPNEQISAHGDQVQPRQEGGRLGLTDLPHLR